MPNWQPLRDARPAAGAGAVSSAGPVAPPVVGASLNEVICAECGKSFTKDNAIQYGTTWVCATCKPLFLQKLREGTPLTPAPGVSISEQDLLTREYRVEIGDCVERAWKIVTGNLGLVIGASLLVFCAAVAGWVISFVASLVIPFANMILPALYSGPLIAGYLSLFLRLGRNEPAGVGNAFEGFQRRGVQLMLCSLVQGILNIACLVPAFGVALAAGFAATFQRGGPPPTLTAGFVIALAAAALAGFAALVYMNIVWTHALLLILDKGYDFWPAMQLSRRMVSKGWWMTFLFLLVGGILSGVGAFACLVGLLVSMPMYYAMRACFYEDNFRDLAPQTRIA
jgi:DNA-directed RNA polymerase subunit RPC12/RpoP